MIKILLFGILFFEFLFRFRAYKFFVFVHTFQWTLSDFFYFFYFLAESLKANETS